MKILSAQQIREADNYTIAHEPIASIDLMERAADALFYYIKNEFTLSTSFCILCGKGNNGGDGLALGRLLLQYGFSTQLYIIEHSERGSDDFRSNLARLKEFPVQYLYGPDDWKGPAPEQILIDAVLGSGLSRPLEGLILGMGEKYNRCPNFKIAIDIPTGLFADDNTENIEERIWRSDMCLSLQLPKLSMFHRETAPLVGEVKIMEIGIDREFIENSASSYNYVRQEEVRTIFRPRQKFSYKGTYGHGLLIAGSKGSVGAAIMSAEAALRAGAGLLTALVPGGAAIPVQTHLPEAMLIADKEKDMVSQVPDLKKFNAIGIGPGLGTDPKTVDALKELLNGYRGKMVLDADALNILSQNKDSLRHLPEGSVLTPHPGEFKRLLGFEKLESNYISLLREFAMKYKVVTVLKDSITTLADVDGRVYFMDFGTPALASPGSGDVLTGIILGLLASGYTPLSAAILGVFLQGRAANLATEKSSVEAVLARDVISNIGNAFRELY